MPAEGAKCWPFTSVSVPADLAHLPDNVLVCYELVAIACWNGILAKAPLFVPRDGEVGHVHLFCFVLVFLICVLFLLFYMASLRISDRCLEKRANTSK